MMTMLHEKIPISEQLCIHCQTPFTPCEEKELFCCSGCAAAHSLIKALGLTQVYNLRPRFAKVGESKSSVTFFSDLSRFDDEEAIQTFVTSCKPGALRTVKLRIDNLRCFACVWLCEQALHSKHGVSAKVNLDTGSLDITYFPHLVKLSSLVGTLQQLGFEVQPRLHEPPSWRDELVRLGVAIFCTLNIMALSFGEYLAPKDGMEEIYIRLFRVVSMILASLALFYAGAEFNRNSWRFLRVGRINIDQPISLALFVAYFYSVYNTTIGDGFVYFDSLSAVIALLLLGRFFQKRALGQAQLRIYSQEAPADQWVRVVRENEFHSLSRDKIEVDDYIRLLPGEIVPVNAELVTSEALFSCESLTGEAELQTLMKGERLRSGMVNGSRPVEVRSLESGLQSYIRASQELTQRLLSEKGAYGELSDRLAKLFLFVLFSVVGILIFTVGRTDMVDAVSRSVAVLLVACPCAFGYAGPLTFAAVASRALKRGIAFRTQRSMESLSKVTDLVFDKTGTLTFGQLVIADAVMSQNPAVFANFGSILPILRSFSHYTSHHVALAIEDWAKKTASIEGSQVFRVDGVEEVFGEGFVFNLFDEKRSENRVLRIGRLSFCRLGDIKSLPTDSTFISIDGLEVARLTMKDKVRAEAESVLKRLRKKGYRLHLLTGDSYEATQQFIKDLGLSFESITAQMTPSAKAVKIQNSERHKRTAMIGNGLNDAVAMAEASIGIAVFNASGYAHQAADISILLPGISVVELAIKLSHLTERIIKRTLGFALLYNSAALLLAAFGYITPFFAAILMPLSSVTVTLSALYWNVPEEV